jgi:ubiquinone biosynthesis protein
VAGENNKTDKIKTESRLKEIREVLGRNHITRGVTPEKLRIILEELGPTYIKLGQIMSLHSDILPKRYCDELMKLNSEVTPMPFSVVEEVINRSYRCDWHDYFQSMDEKPLGSASIAQVHKAVLRDGSEVIVKVQRKGIYDTMARDIGLLHRAVSLLPPVANLRNLVDLNMVLDEMWQVAQEEMDFLKEASNMEEFARNNADVTYVGCPKLYHEYTTSRVLVMQYIGGCPIDDVKSLKEQGYDLNEIGTKLVNNYIKQVMDDGFFHADPHPGNVKVCNGQIIWIDMGMMGRLSERDRMIMVRGVRGIALHDVTGIENAVLDLCGTSGRVDRARLYQDLKKFLERYGSTGMGSINVGDVMQDLMDIMKTNHLSIPHGVTMLARGMTHMEGVLTQISPDINMFEIASTRVSEDYFHNINWKDELFRNARTIYRSSTKGAEIPSLAADALKEYLSGEAKVNIDLVATESLMETVFTAVRNLVIGLCIAALLISSSVLCMTDMKPKILGIPALGALGYAIATAAGTFVLGRYIYNKVKQSRGR